MRKKIVSKEFKKEAARLEKELIQCRRAEKAAREGQDRYYYIFKNALVSLIEISFSKVKSAIDELKEAKDFRSYLKRHPEFIQEAKKMIEIIDINDSALRMLGAKNKKEAIVPLSKIISPEAEPKFIEGLIAVAEGRVYFETESIVETFYGKQLNVMAKLTIPPEKEKLKNMLMSIMDITEMKKMEERLQKAHDELEKQVEERTSELLKANLELKTEIAERKLTEEKLRKRERQLRFQGRRLEEFNAALKVLLKNRENDKKELEERILSNVKDLILPYVTKLKTKKLDPNLLTYIEIIERNLNEIISPFSRELSSIYYRLTPKEIEIAGLIRDGKTTKEIASLLLTAKRTVDFHRNNIRIKLGIKSKKANLRSHLQSLS